MVGLHHYLIWVIHFRSLRRETIDRRIVNSPTTDRILMFEHSRVVETGAFDELLQAGFFRRTRQVAESFRRTARVAQPGGGSRGGVGDMSAI